jgi:dephospho-CoA kinase
MLVVGLIGGIGSGKSQAAQMLRDLGATVLDADAIGHQVLRQGEVIDALVRRFGERILTPQGEISRRDLAKIVFAPGHEADRRFLEQLTHPRIGQRLKEALAELEASWDPPPVVVLDAALLLEAGWDRYCDKILFIDAPRDLRLERAVARGWSAEQFSAREAAQWPLEEKRRRAQIVIRNARTLENLRQVLRLTWQHRLWPDAQQRRMQQKSDEKPRDDGAAGDSDASPGPSPQGAS